ncbi:hypothetical protein [Clostridium vincentii]|uniref:Uncharacterized protein n=1 Tax=Clostridium vincentii TaxID=52704 RepID=A0A2T0BDA8_9CLOT|nr:hypothetical protein [Clostridium vincentii]PRR81879.1 hypothetical protein CLVI_22250 [Clostridium vincentii]
MVSNTTLEQLQLFEHIDNNGAILLSNNNLTMDGNVHIFITNDSLNKWMLEHKDEIENKKITHYTDRLGKALDYVIQNENVKGLIIDGLVPISLYITHKDLQPLKDLVDSFCIMYACICNKIEKYETSKLMANKEIYFIGKMITFQKGDSFGVETIKRKENDIEYESIKVFLTGEHAQKFNGNNRDITKCRLYDLAWFYQGIFQIIIEPHCNYWVELKPEDIIKKC